MKTSILILILSISLSFGFNDSTIEQEYTYRLKVTSLNDEEQYFDVEINSTHESEEPLKLVLFDQVTPFERNLKSGEHEIIVKHLGENSGIKSTITGILNGESKGSASSEDKKAILKAGPGGHYSTAK